MPVIHIKSLSKVYPPGGGLSNVSLAIPAGEHLVVVGPSGAGKTTLLRLLAGLETADSGSIWFEDRDVTWLQSHERRVAFVGQRPGLYANKTVAQNLAAGVTLRQSAVKWLRRLRGISEPIPPEALTAKVCEAAKWLGLTRLLNRPVHGLSGGEQQRVALGRGIVADSKLWLLDEPLAHLDPLLRDEVRGQLLLLRDRLRPTIVEVTHDPADAMVIGHRVAVFDTGRLVQVGSPAEVYSRPACRAASTSLGWPPMNFIDGPAAPDAGASGRTRAILGVRAEDVRLGTGDVDLGEWTLVAVRGIGPADLWTLKKAREPAAAAPGVTLRRWALPSDAQSSDVRLHVLPAKAHWFDRDTGQRLSE